MAFAAILALSAAVLARSGGLDVNRYRGFLQAALAERLGREVSLGRMHLSLVPLALRVENVVIGENPAFQTGRSFLAAEELRLRLRLFPVFQGRLELLAVELRRPLIELVRASDGAWNFTTLGRDACGMPLRGARPLDRLVLTNGEVAVSRRPESRVVYRNIDAQLHDYRSDGPFDIGLAVTLPDHGAERLSLRGRAGPFVREDIGRTSFDGNLTFDRVSLTALRLFLQGRPFEGTDAVVSGTASVRNRDGELSSKGSLRLEQARTHGVALSYPIDTSFDVARDSTRKLLTIRSATVSLDQTPLSLAGTVDLQPTIPELDVHVTASEVSLEKAARLTSAFGLAFGADTRVRGRFSTDIRLRGPASRPGFDGSLQLRDVSISGPDIPQPVRTDAVDLSLTPAEIRSNDFPASTNGTSLGLRIAVKQYTTSNPILDARIQTAGADFGDVLNVARAWGVHAVDGVTGTGRLTLDVRATGPGHAPALSGSGRLEEATLKAGWIAQPLGIHHASLVFSSTGIAAEDLRMSVGRTSATGRISVRNLAAPQVAFQLVADRIDVGDMQRVLGPDRAARPQTARRPAGEPFLLRTTGSGRVRVGSLTYGQVAMDDVDVETTLDRGLIRLEPLVSRLYGGRHRGSIVVDARRTPPAFIVSSHIEQVDANRLATAIVNMRDVIDGALASVARVNFSADGGGAAIARSMNGTLSLDVPNGRIANMDVMYEIARIAQFVARGATARATTPVTGFRGRFTVADGIARTDDLVASLDGGRIGVSGSIDLATEGLDLRVNAVLSRELSRVTAGSDVGGFMSTVLANQRGELVVPMLVTGTLRQPRFAPDLAAIARMKLRSLLPSLTDPQRPTVGILGAILQEPGRGRRPGTELETGLEDALRKLLGVDKQQKPKPKPPPK